MRPISELATVARGQRGIFCDIDDTLTHDGALVLWRIRSGQGIQRTFTTIKGLRILGQKSFVWPDTPKAAPLQIGYAIVPPAAR